MSQTQVEKGTHRLERKTHRNGYRGRLRYASFSHR